MLASPMLSFTARRMTSGTLSSGGKWFSVSAAPRIESFTSTLPEENAATVVPLSPPAVSEADRETIFQKWGLSKSCFFWSLDPKLSLLKSTVNPFFTYTLPNGEERIYSLEIVGYGPQIESSIRIQAGLVLRAPVESLIDHKPITTSGGFDVAILGLHLTWAKFAGHLGGVLLFGVPFGFGFGVSALKPGYLMPASRYHGYNFFGPYAKNLTSDAEHFTAFHSRIQAEALQPTESNTSEPVKTEPVKA